MTPAVVLAAAAAVAAVLGLADAASAAAAKSASRQAGRRHPAHVLAALGRAVGAPAAPPRLQEAVAAAGLSGRITAADVMAVQVGGAVAGALVAVLLAGGASMRALAIVALALCATGFTAPGLWLRARSRRRLYQAALELPAALDLLRVAVDAGLPVRRAIDKVGRHGVGVVADELGLATRRMELGQPLGEAVDTLAGNLPAPPIETLTTAIKRCDRHGASLGPSLQALATEVRAARAIALQERAAKAVPRMQLVIALALVPAVLALVAAVVVARVL